MSEIKQALQAARDIVDACAGDNRPATGWAAKVRTQIDAALSSAAVAEREPVYQIQYHAQDEWHEVSKEAWDSLGDHGKRVLYTTPPTSELEAEIARLRVALEPFADIADLIDSETEGMSETDELALHFHDYLMASWPVALFRAARRVREGGKVDG